MLPLCELIDEKYAVRKTKKQKEAFIQVMMQELDAFNVHREEEQLICGDLNQCDLVIAARYDFCEVIEDKRVLRLILLGLALLSIPLIGICIVLFLYHKWWVVLGIIVLFTVVLSFLFSGDCNNHGVMALIEIIHKQPFEKNVCYVFYTGNKHWPHLPVVYLNYQYSKLLNRPITDESVDLLIQKIKQDESI